MVSYASSQLIGTNFPSPRSPTLLSGVRIHGDEQAAGGLRIVQDILQIQRDAFGEAGGRPGKLTVAVGALRDEAHFGQGLYPGQYRHLGAIDDDG